MFSQIRGQLSLFGFRIYVRSSFILTKFYKGTYFHLNSKITHPFAYIVFEDVLIYWYCIFKFGRIKVTYSKAGPISLYMLK